MKTEETGKRLLALFGGGRHTLAGCSSNLQELYNRAEKWGRTRQGNQTAEGKGQIYYPELLKPEVVTYG